MKSGALDEQSTAPLQALGECGCFFAVSELSGSFRKRQRFGKELWINALNLTKRLNGLNVLNSRVVNQSSLLRFIQRFPGATTEG